MFIKNFQIMFSMLLIMGTVIAVSSNTWFTAWFGLEINLMSMIPLILISLTPQKSEAAIKYFLAQALASVILIFSISLSMINYEILSLEVSESLIFLALILKAGMAPLQFWFPQTSQFLNWQQCLILFTWQKIAPLMLLMSSNIMMIFIVASLSAMVGALGGFNQPFLKLLMTYSSISHSGWMLISCSLSNKTWILYFLIYCFLSFSVIFYFLTSQINKTSQIFLNNEPLHAKMILSMNILSLGGLPPLLGFSAKLSILILIIKSTLVMWILPLILSSLLSLFFYLRLIYSNLLNFNKKINLLMFFSNKSTYFMTFSSVFMNLMLPVFLILS